MYIVLFTVLKILHSFIIIFMRLQYVFTAFNSFFLTPATLTHNHTPIQFREIHIVEICYKNPTLIIQIIRILYET